MGFRMQDFFVAHLRMRLLPFAWIAVLYTGIFVAGDHCEASGKIQHDWIVGCEKVTQSLEPAIVETKIEQQRDGRSSDFSLSGKHLGRGHLHIVKGTSPSAPTCEGENDDYVFSLARSEVTDEWIIRNFEWQEAGNEKSASRESPLNGDDISGLLSQRIRPELQGITLCEVHLADVFEYELATIEKESLVQKDGRALYEITLARSPKVVDPRWFFQSGTIYLDPLLSWQIVSGTLELMNGIGATCIEEFENEYDRSNYYDVATIVERKSVQNWSHEGTPLRIIRSETNRYFDPESLTKVDFRLSSFGLPEPPAQGGGYSVAMLASALLIVCLLAASVVSAFLKSRKSVNP